MKKKNWLQRIKERLETLPEKHKFHIKRINLEEEVWLYLDDKNKERR